MAALQNLPVTYVMTHDSVAVGEDGPTHEPIEQLASVRSMPTLTLSVLQMVMKLMLLGNVPWLRLNVQQC